MFTHKYLDVLSVVPALTDEWLHATIGQVPDEAPVFGWPLDGKLEVAFVGQLPEEDHEKIKDIVYKHFDGNREEMIFPIADIEVRTTERATYVTVTGDVTRAADMQQLRTLA